jgi:hypothetical protein
MTLIAVVGKWVGWVTDRVRDATSAPPRLAPVRVRARTAPPPRRR